MFVDVNVLVDPVDPAKTASSPTAIVALDALLLNLDVIDAGSVNVWVEPPALVITPINNPAFDIVIPAGVNGELVSAVPIVS